MEKFEVVAEEYTERFGYEPYYSSLVSLMKKYCKGKVLEIGAANGILAEKLEQSREIGDEYFKYRSVEPRQKLVDIALEKANKIQTFRYLPHTGSLENALTTSGLENDQIDVIITSRSLHEAFIEYSKDENEVFLYLNKILNNKRPSIVIHGILERYSHLNEEETKEFIKKQEQKIGHGHDPDKDYLDFQLLTEFMVERGYRLIEEDHISQPLLENHPKAWTFGIGVFEKGGE